MIRKMGFFLLFIMSCARLNNSGDKQISKNEANLTSKITIGIDQDHLKQLQRVAQRVQAALLEADSPEKKGHKQDILEKLTQDLCGIHVVDTLDAEILNSGISEGEAFRCVKAVFWVAALHMAKKIPLASTTLMHYLQNSGSPLILSTHNFLLEEIQQFVKDELYRTRCGSLFFGMILVTDISKVQYLNPLDLVQACDYRNLVPDSLSINGKSFNIFRDRVFPRSEDLFYGLGSIRLTQDEMSCDGMVSDEGEDDLICAFKTRIHDFYDWEKSRNPSHYLMSRLRERKQAKPFEIISEPLIFRHSIRAAWPRRSGDPIENSKEREKLARHYTKIFCSDWSIYQEIIEDGVWKDIFEKLNQNLTIEDYKIICLRNLKPKS